MNIELARNRRCIFFYKIIKHLDPFSSFFRSFHLLDPLLIFFRSVHHPRPLFVFHEFVSRPEAHVASVRQAALARDVLN